MGLSHTSGLVINIALFLTVVAHVPHVLLAAHQPTHTFSDGAEKCFDSLVRLSQPSFSHADKLLRMMEASSTFACVDDPLIDQVDGNLRARVAQTIFNATICKTLPKSFCNGAAAAAESLVAIPEWARIPIAFYESLLSARTNPQVLNVSLSSLSSRCPSSLPSLLSDSQSLCQE